MNLFRSALLITFSLNACAMMTACSTTAKSEIPAATAPAHSAANSKAKMSGMNKIGRTIASEEIKCQADPGSPGPGIDPEYVISQINASEYCSQAATIAESCAAGSSMDSSMAGAAADFCDAKTGKMIPSDKALQNKMWTRCMKVCNPKTDGTLCLSQQAFCRLDVAKFLNFVNSKMD